MPVRDPSGLSLLAAVVVVAVLAAVAGCDGERPDTAPDLRLTGSPPPSSTASAVASEPAEGPRAPSRDVIAGKAPRGPMPPGCAHQTRHFAARARAGDTCRAEVLVADPSDDLLSAATSFGFDVMETVRMPDLGLDVVSLRAPPGATDLEAIDLLAACFPDVVIDRKEGGEFLLQRGPISRRTR